MSSERAIQVSIIIVNYHEEQYLVPLLESLLKYERAVSKEVLILDNQSRTPIPELLQNKFEDVTVFPQKGNKGFGRTNNTGIQLAKGKYLLLMNPDMLLESDCISHCIRYFESQPDRKIGAVAVRLKNPDGSFQRSFFQLAASIKKTWQLNPAYFKLFGNRIKNQTSRHDEQMHEKVSDAPWLCGAFLLMNRETVMTQKFFFDEDFFLYSEDCELTKRMKRKGYRLMFLPDESIVHYGGGSMPHIRRFEQLTISEWLCMMKVHGKFYFLCNQLLLACNMVMQSMLDTRNQVFRKVSYHDKREKIYRQKMWRLWKRYTFRILMGFSRRPSYSQKMLVYSEARA
jgi:GT2 family glycosyltransferase